MHTIKASVGTWYEDLSSGAQFKVVALDEAEETVEMQMLDGEICEYDIESWAQMTVQRIEEPEDWRLGFELSTEDGRDPDQTFNPDSSINPIDEIETDIINGLDDDY